MDKKMLFTRNYKWIWLFGFVCFFAVSGIWAQPRAERLRSMRSTVRDYDARLAEAYHKHIRSWQKRFGQERRDRIAQAAREIVRQAIFLRDRRQISWPEIGDNPEFISLLERHVRELTDASELRSQLLVWAQAVEAHTRLEVVRCFQQVVAYDLGMKFDERLRSKVIEAVRAIDVERLVSPQNSQQEIIDQIKQGLPGALITSQQKRYIARAVGVLVQRVVTLMATSQLGLAEGATKFVSMLAFEITRQVSEKGLHWFDRRLSGEPQIEADRFPINAEPSNLESEKHRRST